MLVHPTLGGSAVRIRLSNFYGDEDVTFSAVNVARAVASGAPDLVSGTSRPVTFHGRGSVTVRTGTHCSAIRSPSPSGTARTSRSTST
jgi:hypothetical protein